ncbi:hypothetical protein [Terricaulis sp.]|uniref:hypothetical protein n=1 Tax=Terricaulis sp. TaxID=2768686 RepID=UPI002AC537F5|nr:hypothetical protein [Terricaulis sp.]MDZ4692043.1 hypothetical protein [Terricaulis sp.]
MRAPIPQIIAPLTWRRPALIWTPLALAAAIGWPAALFMEEPSLQRLALVAGMAVFAIALITLGASWALGKAPRARRVVVLHVVLAGALIAVLAPFVLTQLLAALADYEQNGAAAASFTTDMALAMAPLALIIGLPMTSVSALLFSWLALTRDAA